MSPKEVYALVHAKLREYSKEHFFDKNNDVIVFETSGGLIVHRAALSINDDDGKLLFLTKGDNNQALDQEGPFSPVEKKDIHGTLLFKVPFVGYLKLLLFGQFETPDGCEPLSTVY